MKFQDFLGIPRNSQQFLGSQGIPRVSRENPRRIPGVSQEYPRNIRGSQGIPRVPKRLLGPSWGLWGHLGSPLGSQNVLDPAYCDYIVLSFCCLGSQCKGVIFPVYFSPGIIPLKRIVQAPSRSQPSLLFSWYYPFKTQCLGTLPST